MVVSAICLLMTATLAVPPSDVAGRKLIRAGDLLTSAFGAAALPDIGLPARVKMWQDRGLDGLAFCVTSSDPDKAYHVMAGQWWNVVPRTDAEFARDVAAFQSVGNWGRLTDNFLWGSIGIWSDPGLPVRTHDWFDDDGWAVVLNNVRVQARVARACGFKGILLDTEQYAHHGRGPWRFPFNYPLYAESLHKEGGEGAPRSYEACVDKVYQRARAYARAVSGEFPDLVLFVIPGLYEVTWRLMTHRYADRTLAECDEALYPAFVDGLLAGLDERATIVAGTESTYAMSAYRDMLVERDAIRQSLTLARDPRLARRRITFAVGLWTDCGWGPDRFSDTDVSSNSRDPLRHEHAVHNALAASDRYAWQWGETSHFLSPDPTPLLGAYFEANARGHEPHDLAWAPVPRWDLTDYGDHDADMARRDAAFWPQAERDGYRVALELPELWHFFFDDERLVRFGWQTEPTYDYAAWPLISTRRCWQSQSFRSHGMGLYRTSFVAPTDLDPKRGQVVIAIGALPVADSDTGGWMDLSLNGKGYPIARIIDVTESIRPGAPNQVVIRVVNRAGPGGPGGRVKVLVRPGAD